MPDYLHKHSRTAIGYINFLKSALLESDKEFSNWPLISLWGKIIQAIYLPLGFTCNTCRCEFLKFSGSPKCPDVLPRHLPWKQPLLLTWKDCIPIGKVTRLFLHGAFTGFKINLQFLKFWWHLESRYVFSQIWHSSQSCLIKAQLYSIIQRTDSFWIYANKYIAMKILLFTH